MRESSRNKHRGGWTNLRTTRHKTTPGNAAMAAVQECAALFGVRAYRMQSRVHTVVGAGGVERPMFIGGWHDKHGIFHTRGMADFLLTPEIWILGGQKLWAGITIPVWVEVKAGRDELSKDQLLFRDDVKEAGADWICCQDSCDALIEFFREHGVVRS